MSDPDLLKALEAVERGMGRLRRCRARRGDAEFDALMATLGLGHSRQAMRVQDWLRTRLPPEAALDPAVAAAPTTEEAAPNSETAAPTATDADEPGLARVIERRAVSADLLVLRLSRPPGFSYRAGDYVKLTLAGVSRPYSLVSAPHEADLEFFIELHPGGRQAGALRTVESGTPIRLGTPKPGVALSTAHRRHLMVATVTGIAPIVSLLRERFRQAPADEEFHVLHGASYQDEFGYAGELQELAARQGARLYYRPAVSRPEEARNAGWTGDRGRVADRVDGYLREQGLTAADTAVYACGQPDMVAAVRQRYAAAGFEVHAEAY